jgi:predicted AAA+ superfamily ATPase
MVNETLNPYDADTDSRMEPMSLLTACTPRTEVLEGELDDAIFAASLVDLVGGTAKPVYGDARTFFANTHPAAQLRDTARRVFLHLTDASQGGAFIRLSTGFGGGKTHALMTLWHLAENSGDPSIGAEIVDPAARPQAVTVVAIDVGAAGAPNFAQHGSVTTHSLWGEVAYQLAGEAGLQALGEGEALDRQPNLDEFRGLFPEGPVLILMDELVMYMAGLREAEQKGLLNFINKLIGICASRPLTALVISDPATQAVYAAQTQALAKAMAAQDADQITAVEPEPCRAAHRTETNRPGW